MKRILFFALLTAGAAACKKETHECPQPAPPTPAAPSTAAYTMLTPGNYWVYGIYRVDTDGVETYQQLDSLYVSGETVYNGHTYAQLEGGILWTGLYRDSAGFLLDTAGNIRFTNVVTGLPVRTESLGTLGYVEYRTAAARPTITVPAGTFANTYDWQSVYYFTNSPWGNPRVSHQYFAEGIGRVLIRYYYFSTPDTWEERLVRYHVQ